MQKDPLTGRDRAPGTFPRAIIVSDKSGDNRAARERRDVPPTRARRSILLRPRERQDRDYYRDLIDGRGVFVKIPLAFGAVPRVGALFPYLQFAPK